MIALISNKSCTKSSITLEHNVGTENHSRNLLTITNDANRGARTHGDSYIIDAWTRVTSCLFVIHMEGKYGKLTNGLKNSIKTKVAKYAKEQKTITYTLWKEVYIFLQHPFFIPILLPINIVCFLLIKLIVWLIGLK